MYEEAIRTPLLISLPGRFPSRRVVGAMTESVDIAPTILEALGAGPLEVSHGSSLVPLLEGATERHRDVVFSEYLENEEAAVRTERWKLIQCSGRRHRRDGLETDDPTPGSYLRLYDLAHDPAELTDLVGLGILGDQHARYLADRSDVTLRAVADIESARAEATARDHRLAWLYGRGGDARRAGA